MGISGEALFPVVTLVLGAVLKGLFDWLSENRSERRRREERQEQRADTRQLKHLEFQQTALLELQDVITRLGRLVGAAHYQDIKNLRETGRWHGAHLTEEVNLGLLTEQQSFNKLRVRIRDREVRELAKLFSLAGTTSTQAGDEATAKAAMLEMAHHFETLNERIGELLRNLAQDEETLLKDGA